MTVDVSCYYNKLLIGQNGSNSDNTETKLAFYMGYTHPNHIPKTLTAYLTLRT